MSRTRVAVTGASGFVGRWLMAHLQSLGVDAVPFFDNSGVGLEDAAAIRSILATQKPDAIVHLAAVAAPADARKAPVAAFDTNVIGTLNLASAILDIRPQARLIFAGSSEAYGRSFNTIAAPLDETAPLEPQTLYGVTKASADMLLGQMAADGLQVVRFRPFNHTGPGQSESYVVPAFARQIALIEAGRQEPVIEVGDLEAERDFSDVRDIVRAYARAAMMNDPLPAGVAVNLASGMPRPISDVLARLLKMSREPIEVRTDPMKLGPVGTRRAVGNVTRASDLLDWRVEIPFEKTLQDVLEAWRTNR
ncbi:NAD-dependent epimerase/dehydratase family protein [Aureimonas altamirensis]|jgi:GDP-4-dehydro-6-deoxy-D-mannose reductase|uniref:NAD-dependent epimerase/dehydratase family protein n=1 Tax=Aureimonas altamirensis TaxID=370622 RepID=UPI003017F4BA